jgi:hypothetical protein
VPDTQLLLLASNLRARAEVILAKAETVDDAGARLTMREIASRHEKEHGADEA